MISIKLVDNDIHTCEVLKNECDCRAMDMLLMPYLQANVFECTEDKYRFSFSLLALWHQIFQQTKFVFDYSDIARTYETPVNKFDVSEQDFLRDNQYEIVKDMSKHYRGLVQLATGGGKTEIMLYMTKHYKEPVNKLILTNNNQVATEIKLRCQKYNLNPDKMNLRILNPLSFMASNAVNDMEWQAFLKDVQFIQIDELESVPPSVVKFLEFCPNYKVLYGYSASPEKIKGLNLTDGRAVLKVKEDALNVMKLAGFSLFYKAPSKPLQVNIVTMDLPQEKFPPWLMKDNDSPGALVMKQKISQNTLFKYGHIFKALDRVILPQKKKILFIPYRFIEHGDKLFEHYRNSSWRIVQWDGEKIRSNIPGHEELTQAEIKELSKENSFDILIASSVANRGVDFRNMEDVFLYIHSQYANVIQTVGRCSREASDKMAYVWLLHGREEKRTPFYSMLCRARLNRIKSAYSEAGVNVNTQTI